MGRSSGNNGWSYDDLLIDSENFHCLRLQIDMKFMSGKPMMY